MNRLTIHSSLLVCVALIAPACALTADAEDMTGADESALDLGLSLQALRTSTTPEPAAMADAMVANSDGDDGCKTRVKDENDPNVVHVFLDNCTDRFGRHTRSGEITVTFSEDASNLKEPRILREVARALASADAHVCSRVEKHRTQETSTTTK